MSALRAVRARQTLLPENHHVRAGLSRLQGRSADRLGGARHHAIHFSASLGARCAPYGHAKHYCLKSIMFAPAYLDYNASTPLEAAVRDTMLSWLEKQWGNASSRHEYGRAARKAIDEARQQ